MEILFDIMTITLVSFGVYAGLKAALRYGGIVGKGLKIIVAGIIVFGINWFMYGLHYFGIEPLATIGEKGHVIIHHFLMAFAFALVAVGFYILMQITKKSRKKPDVLVPGITIFLGLKIFTLKSETQ